MIERQTQLALQDASREEELSHRLEAAVRDLSGRLDQQAK